MDTEQPSLPVSDQLIQLRKARSLVLRDAVFWPQIFQGVLPIVSGPYVELRRWGAEFLAETFSTPTLDEAKKTELALLALDTLVGLIHEMEADLLKNAVQASASIYPLLFRYMYVCWVI